MTATELLARLRELNLNLRAHDGRLILTGPKGVLTSDLRAELAERKGEILKVLNNAPSSSAPGEASLRHVERNGRLPLSFSQKRLWFLCQLEPDSSVYNISSAQRLKGGVDAGALERCLNEIVRRHESLRTIFAEIEGEPVQIVTPSMNRPLTVVDLRDCPEGDREEQARRLASEEARRPFDLGRGPLFRTMLIRLGSDDHVLLLMMHHIVSDGWSMAVLHREIGILYRAFCQFQPSPLPELPIQYADYAIWQQERLKGEELQRQLAYWKKHLRGAPAVLSLPADRPRPVIQSYRGARFSFEISRELTEALKALGQKEGATLFMTLLAAFQALLYRHTGQRDVVLGSPIANRTRMEIEGLIGFFVNTLVFRTDLSGNPTFRELLHRVRKTALEAYEHQDLPFEKLVEEIKPERTLSHSPLFQVMFVLHNAPASPWELPGLNVSSTRLDNGTTKFDLSLSLIEHTHGITGSIEYSTDLFGRQTISRLSGHFLTLLEGVAVNPERTVSDLPVLGELEKHELLYDWNDTDREYPENRCIHELFEEQVARTPDAVAVVFEGKQLSYRELNRRANQLARYLIHSGVGPEALVGICVERSLEMIVAILGVLKAGAAYMPQDPRFPNERLAFMWEEARLSVLLTQDHLIEVLPLFPGKVVCMDRDWSAISREDYASVNNRAIAENLAYVIYTSGSTGRPKGVQLRHRSVVNAVTQAGEVFGLTEQDTLAFVANICFDISVLELFLPLVTGARLVVVSAQDAVDGERIGQILSSYGVTLLHATPATWRLLLQVGWHGHKRLKILSGGEALPCELAEQLASGGSSLWNLYGPTETTIYSSVNGYRPQFSDGTVPIGRPIGNTQIYILDEHLQPVPIGVPGQLCIGGTGLARGYLNRAELTAASFIPDPFGKKPGGHLYRTGDLARYLSDGNIQYLGRMDHQIKLHGFRIEPGEIESVLGRHPAVRQALVVVREDCPDEKRLVGYVITDGTVEAAALRNFLKAKLPDYMIPSAFVFLDSLPLNSNGKVDRHRLPPPDASRPELETAFVAPRTPREELLANVWRQVLKLERVGVYDNFFDLGGHSLLATQVISRVRAAIGIELPLRSLFEYPTVASLTDRIEDFLWARQEPARGSESEEREEMKL